MKITKIIGIKLIFTLVFGTFGIGILSAYAQTNETISAKSPFVSVKKASPAQSFTSEKATISTVGLRSPQEERLTKAIMSSKTAGVEAKKLTTMKDRIESKSELSDVALEKAAFDLQKNEQNPNYWRRMVGQYLTRLTDGPLMRAQNRAEQIRIRLDELARIPKDTTKLRGDLNRANAFLAEIRAKIDQDRLRITAANFNPKDKSGIRVELRDIRGMIRTANHILVRIENSLNHQ